MDKILVCPKCGSKKVKKELVTLGSKEHVSEEPCRVCQVCKYIVERLGDEEVNDMQEAEVDGEIIKSVLENAQKIH
jgi:RNA polymerase subunit RPABC4/transcription elongation factor Spt4